MEPWEFLLLAFGVYRVWRVVARDSITEKAREAATGFADKDAPPLAAADDWFAAADAPGAVGQAKPAAWAPSRRGRIYVSAFLRCPWCSGFWLSVAAYLLWRQWPDATVVAATPLALSTSLGIIRKKLDPDQ